MVDKEKMAAELMNEMVKRINDSAEMMADWGKAFQMVFTDINTGYWLKVAMNGKVEKLEKVIKDKTESAAVISCSVNTFKGLMNKTIGAQSALGSGELKVDGPMSELLKLNLVFS